MATASDAAPADSHPACLSRTDALHLVHGSQMYKFGRNGKPGLRLVRVSSNYQELQWTSKRKKPRDSSVRLADVVRIQAGRRTAKFARFPSGYGQEHHSFSLIYATPSGTDKTLDLTCLTPSEYKVWFASLQALIQHAARAKGGDDVVEADVSSQAHAAFYSVADEAGLAPGAARLDWRHIRSALQKLGLGHVTRSEASDLLFEGNPDGSATVAPFVAFVHRVMHRSDIQALFDTLCDGRTTMTRSEFSRFLRSCQGHSSSLISACAGALSSVASGAGDGGASSGDASLTCAAFGEYLWSAANDAVAPQTSVVYQDMTRPLSHYFVASSHNTYLEGDQLTSRSSVNMYINVLLAGCRCVELDCHDGPDMEPVIYHGRTLTTRIKLRAVVQAVREYGFTASPYPVILSLEMHCSVPQQRRVAEILSEELGDLLLGPLLDTESFQALPSPWSLRGRVIIKGKTLTKVINPQPVPVRYLRQQLVEHARLLAPALAPVAPASAVLATSPSSGAGAGAGGGGVDSGSHHMAGRLLDDSVQLSTVDASGMDSHERTQRRRLRRASESLDTGPPASVHLSKTTRTTSCPDLLAAVATDHVPVAKDGKQRNPVARELARVISLRAIKFPGFEASTMNSACIMSSFREAKFRALVRRDAPRVVLYNARHLSRVYPNPIRVDSSNFDPFVGWALGVQMTALNYQTHGLPMLLNLALFQQNGGCGYVLRPRWMCNPPPLASLRRRVQRNLAPPPKHRHIHVSRGSPAAATVGVGVRAGVDSTRSCGDTADVGNRAQGGVNGAAVGVATETAAASPSTEPPHPLPASALASAGLLVPEGTDAEPFVLELEILSAKQLPVPKAGSSASPYCCIHIRGVPRDMFKGRTRTVKHNGANPMWRHRLEVEVVEPSIAILFIAVCHHMSMHRRDDAIAYFAVPLTSLRRGYRRCQLVSRTGKPIPQSQLLCRFGRKPLAPSGVAMQAPGRSQSSERGTGGASGGARRDARGGV